MSRTERTVCAGLFCVFGGSGYSPTNIFQLRDEMPLVGYLKRLALLIL